MNNGQQDQQNRLRQYQSLLAVAEAIATQRDLASLFKHLAEYLRAVVAFDVVATVLYDPVRDLMACKCVTLLSALLLLIGSAFAQQVNVDYDKGTDFSKYKTFAWGKGTPADNPLVHQRIVAGVEGQLAMKGMRKMENNPDIVVIYHAATDTQVSVSTMGGGPLGGWCWSMGTAYVDRVPVGQLVVDIGDRSSKKFVWRGTASGTINNKPEKNEKALYTALTKMFQNFPQPPGKKK